jgi:hypothetical protein
MFEFAPGTRRRRLKDAGRRAEAEGLLREDPDPTRAAKDGFLRADGRSAGQATTAEDELVEIVYERDKYRRQLGSGSDVNLTFEISSALYYVHGLVDAAGGRRLDDKARAAARPDRCLQGLIDCSAPFDDSVDPDGWPAPAISDDKRDVAVTARLPFMRGDWVNNGPTCCVRPIPLDCDLIAAFSGEKPSNQG